MEKLNNRQFNQYCDLVYREAGIHLTEEKRELLNARIAKRLRVQNVSPDVYFGMIQNDPLELKFFLDAVTTNHTFFFRESRSFRYLDRGCSEIWCAASSSGEEPYSLAIYCLERGFKPSIMATDISVSCLEKGTNGVYPMQSVADIPKHLLGRYFQKGQGRFQGYVKVKDDVRRMVNFQRFNLVKDIPKSKTYDFIFCRNVMIYFDNESKEKVVGKLSNVLRTGGNFIIGGSESLSGLEHPLKYIEPSVYLKA
ncbi:MAG: protein-glutamate O-methyltransferase CheR [Desulfobacteraceae bacterium]|nr:MAG: protein-glutamate O-methyltransferase CheR [Desulfobacteraceae bacterium]